MACQVPGIPESLHRNNREVDNDFSSDNKLFIRIEPKHIFITTNEQGKETVILSIAAFKSNLQSCNRDKYGQATDVLYNIHADSMENHFTNWAVISVEKVNLTNQEYQHAELGISYKIGLRHQIEECMYPHSEVIIYNSQDKLQENIELSSKTIKAKIRAFYLDNFLLEKKPN